MNCRRTQVNVMVLRFPFWTALDPLDSEPGDGDDDELDEEHGVEDGEGATDMRSVLSSRISPYR